jgi:murein DD-endopeptidase MepM/ murein hydrolase activator NlpD
VAVCHRTAGTTVAGLVLVVAFVRAPAATGQERQAVTYRPPVDAVAVVDPFRPPTTPYGPGNVGVDYGTTPGQPVHAAAAGEVVFAGPVGTSRHVVVLHQDGIRTSYSFLATTTVRRAQKVEQGDVVGTTGEQALHFGARAPTTAEHPGHDVYLDPLVLLGQRAGRDPGDDDARARLVADPDATRPLSESVEKRRLLDSIRGLLRSGGAWLAQQAADRAQAKLALARSITDSALDLGVPFPYRLAAKALEWQAQQDAGRCTPGQPPPPPPDHPAAGQHPPRLAILVGGLGSRTGETAVLDVDTTALGYDPVDVVQFDYRADGRPYEPADTLGDIGAAGRLLADRIARLQRDHPGSAVDVIAHSQGGLVARSAITTHHAAPTTVVTLGTPHQGTDLATAATLVDGSPTGHGALTAIGRAARATGLTEIDPTATAITQLGETSEFLRHLPQRGWPEATFVVSLAARGDPVVPNHHSHLDDPPAYNAVVTAFGTETLGDHSRLPASPEATAEIARALVRQPPACRTLRDALLDAAVGWRQSDGEDLVGAALAIAALTG